MVKVYLLLLTLGITLFGLYHLQIFFDDNGHPGWNLATGIASIAVGLLGLVAVKRQDD